MRSCVTGTMAVCYLAAVLTAQTPPTTPPGSSSPISPSQAPGSTLPGQTAPGTTAPGQAALPGARQPGSALPSGGEDQLFIELKLNYNFTQINPPTLGPDGRPLESFLTPGDNVTTDLTVFDDHKYGDGRIQMLGIFRTTNDPRVDPEQNSFQRGYFRYYNAQTEINLGDYLVNYSRFSFNENIKGLSYVHKFGKKYKFSANAGVFTDRWGSIFKDYIVGQPFTRFVAGFRFEDKLAPNKIIGLNFSEGHDLAGSIRPDLVNGLVGVNNQLVSVDSKLDFGRKFSTDGEFAFSLSNPDIEHLHVEVGDWAARFDTRYRSGPFFLKTSYTRMEPNFLSVNARQLADLQDAGFNIGSDLGNHATLEGSFRYTNNDLRHQVAAGPTIFKVPEVKMSFRQLPHLGRAIFDAGYRERRQTGPFLDTPFNTGTSKNVRIPYADVSMPISTTLFTIGYEHRFNNDYRDSTQTTNVNRVSFSIRSILDLKGWQFSPLFRYEIEREYFVSAAGTNDNRNIQGIMYIEAPKYFLAEAIYRQVGASLFTQCITAAAMQCGSFTSQPVGSSVLLGSGFARPQYRFAVTYKFKNSDSRELVLSLDRNSNYYGYASSSTNFDERIFALTLLWRYKK